MTRLEEKILAFISRYMAEQGVSPTLAEIGEAVSVRSRGTVHRYLTSLISQGYLSKRGRSWRSISLTKRHARSLTVLPLLGQIEAGKPISPIANKTQMNFSAELLGPNRFVLKVVGDTMIEAGIRDGDMVIVHKTTEVKDGAIVVALIDDGEVTLRRLRSHGDRIELVPDNQKLVSLIYPTERVHIQGQVVGQFRIY